MCYCTMLCVSWAIQNANWVSDTDNGRLKLLSYSNVMFLSPTGWPVINCFRCESHVFQIFINVKKVDALKIPTKTFLLCRCAFPIYIMLSTAFPYINSVIVYENNFMRTVHDWRKQRSEIFLAACSDHAISPMINRPLEWGASIKKASRKQNIYGRNEPQEIFCLLRLNAMRQFDDDENSIPQNNQCDMRFYL